MVLVVKTPPANAGAEGNTEGPGTASSVPLLPSCSRQDASPSQGPWDPDSLRPALSLGGQATAGDCSPGRSLCLTKSSACGRLWQVAHPRPLTIKSFNLLKVSRRRGSLLSHLQISVQRSSEIKKPPLGVPPPPPVSEGCSRRQSCGLTQSPG